MYGIIEKAVQEKLASGIKDLQADCCVIADTDALLENIMTSNAPIGFLIEFAGGERLHDPAFAKSKWVWRINGVLWVRFSGNEADCSRLIRETVDQMRSIFADDPRLGGVTALVTVEKVAFADTAYVNDIPFYLVPFQLEALDKE